MNTTTTASASAGSVPVVNQVASSNNNDDDDVLDLSHKNLDHRDLKRILTKLGSSGREYRPRKCRRVDVKRDEIDSRIHHAISCSKIPVYKLRFAGNPAIGDSGMKHLSLIPDSVHDLDLSECNLSCEGIKTVCEFIARNKNITRLFLGGNEMNNDAALALCQMLEENDTLYELCINATKSNGYHSLQPVFWVCYGLRYNRTLRHLHFTCPHVDLLGQAQWYREFAEELPDNSRLRTLECGSFSEIDTFPSYFDSILEDVYGKWAVKLKKNQRLYSIYGGSFLKTPKANDIRYYLSLNKCHARRIVSNPNSSRGEWLDSVTWASRKHKLGALYYLIRNKPEVCKFC